MTVKEAFDKALATIQSCTNNYHVMCCRKLIKNFRRKYREDIEMSDYMDQLIEAFVTKHNLYKPLQND